MKQHALSTASTNLPCESHPRIFKSKPVGDICLDVAKFAGDRDCRTLEYLMKVAAAEAYECLDAPIDTSFQVKSFGMWDWDVSSNLAYVDPTTAGLFGIDPQLGAQGLDLGEFIGNIHPDDVAGFCAALRAVTLHGGNFETRYRVVANDDVRWVYAKGACFMSKGTPTRFPGTLVDVSDMMLPG